MTRETFTLLFPDLAAVFRYTEDDHPFWSEVADITEEEARIGSTVLTDLEQAAAWARSVNDDAELQQAMEQAQTRDELMSAFAKLTVAYVYRHHDARMATGASGVDVELEMADQLLAVGVVSLSDFRPIAVQTEQFEAQQQWADDILDRMEQRARTMKEQPQHHHRILGVITPHTDVMHEYLLSHHLAPKVDGIQRRHPHISGVVLIDPTPSNERTVFFPFHTAHRYLEQWLNRL